MPCKPTSIACWSARLVREPSADLPGPDTIAGPYDLVAYVTPALAALDREGMIAVALDTRRHPLAWTWLSLGSMDGAACDPRVLLRWLVLQPTATACCIAHNHPSGNVEPSAEDIAVTRRLEEALKMLGYRLLDHVIVAPGAAWHSISCRPTC